MVEVMRVGGEVEVEEEESKVVERKSWSLGRRAPRYQPPGFCSSPHFCTAIAFALQYQR